MHGGLSTGPRTLEGLSRSQRARWKHGAYSRLQREIAELEREAAEIVAEFLAKGRKRYRLG